jgi:hypothetical protein
MGDVREIHRADDVDGMMSVMDALTPQLLDAMPAADGRAHAHTIGHAPAAIREPMFKVMAPMMPVLFPIMLPGMMPKVLPHMIRLVESSIEMPDYLRNQLPDLFPGGRGQRHAQDAAGDRAEVHASAVRQPAQLNTKAALAAQSPASAAASVSCARSTSRTMSQAWVICG